MSRNIKKYAIADLYDMASGLSSKKEQAGHGAPFVSFGTVFNNYFLPEILPDLMDTSEKEQETYSIKENDILITRTSETIDELAMSCVAVKDYPNATYSGFTKRLRPKTDGIAYAKYLAFYLRGYLFRKSVTNNAFMTLRASFNEDIFSFLNLYLPEYPQQVLMGNLLYNIEHKIQVNKKINDNLEQMANQLFEHWFVQFKFPSSNNEMSYND
ncbi:MAG: restriction endonuclease subunit S, partial [Clostridia bacterium]|nr:restriction endonuclease subunit S [Clostridia bacterium]